jgi:hypothetical protein
VGVFAKKIIKTLLAKKLTLLYTAGSFHTYEMCYSLQAQGVEFVT